MQSCFETSSEDISNRTETVRYSPWLLMMVPMDTCMSRRDFLLFLVFIERLAAASYRHEGATFLVYRIWVTLCRRGFAELVSFQECDASLVQGVAFKCSPYSVLRGRGSVHSCAIFAAVSRGQESSFWLPATGHGLGRGHVRQY